MLPLLKNDNYKNKKKLTLMSALDKIKSNDDENNILKTIDRRNTSKKINNKLLEKIKIKNIKIKENNK